jgi:hypothetical protein
MTYAVVWSENGGPRYAGSLELADRCLTLSGTANGALESRRRLAYCELAEPRVERHPEARLAGRPTLVLEHREAGPVRVVSLEGTGALHELLERIAEARGKAAA